jgi:hypothetical protein
MLSITILFRTGEMIVIKTFCSIFYLLYKSFHQVLKASIIDMVFQPEPFTSIIIIIPSSTICVNDFSTTIPIPQLSEELITNKNCPFP